VLPLLPAALISTDLTYDKKAGRSTKPNDQHDLPRFYQSSMFAEASPIQAQNLKGRMYCNLFRFKEEPHCSYPSIGIDKLPPAVCRLWTKVAGMQDQATTVNGPEFPSLKLKRAI
jgi:hypothetical protein